MTSSVTLARSGRAELAASIRALPLAAPAWVRECAARLAEGRSDMPPAPTCSDPAGELAAPVLAPLTPRHPEECATCGRMGFWCVCRTEELNRFRQRIDNAAVVDDDGEG